MAKKEKTPTPKKKRNPPLKVDMSFEELLKMAANTPKQKKKK